MPSARLDLGAQLLAARLEPGGDRLGVDLGRGEHLDRADRGDRVAPVLAELEAGEAADELLRLDPLGAGREDGRHRHLDQVAPGAQAPGQLDPRPHLGLGLGVEQRLVGLGERVDREVALPRAGGRTRSPR